MPSINQPIYTNDSAIETPSSGVAWTAIMGGAFAIAGVTLLLIPFGAAFGLANSSPWHQDMGGGKALSAAGAIWLVVAQWLPSGIGGYLTGRLRTKWVSAHTHEVFFRDTAHGFLTWTLAALFSTLLLLWVPSHFQSHMGSIGENAGHGTPLETYYTDSLFRSAQSTADIPESERRQVTYTLTKSIMSKDGISPEDRAYLIQVVSAHTGLSADDAEARIDNVITHSKTEWDITRKNASKLSLMIALSMLIGAFIASSAAALGGRDRDIHYTTGRFNP